MDNSKYSIALCTYNGSDYLEDQLQSILNQTIPPSEIIISDDGSSDNTIDIAENVLSKTGISYSIVINKHNIGVMKNFCNAISLCSCPIVFTSDQDDVWIEDKAERILETFNQNPNAKLVFSNGFLVDENLGYLGADIWDEVRITKRMLKKTKWFDYLLNRCLVTGATMAMKKELFSSSDVIPERGYHDAWFAFKASINNGLVACNHRLIKYRQHSRNVAGMDNYNSTKRLKLYFTSIKYGKEAAEENKKMFETYKECSIGFMNATQIKKLNQCIKFWDDRVLFFSEKKKTKIFKLVAYHFFNGDYKRYTHGFFSALRDLLLLCLV